MVKQVKVYIKGDVIGVGFRAWTKIQAKIIGVHGWVKNVYSQPEIFGAGGGVEALIQGEEKKIEQIIELLKKGPPISRVEETKVVWMSPQEMFEGFKVIK